MLLMLRTALAETALNNHPFCSCD